MAVAILIATAPSADALGLVGAGATLTNFAPGHTASGTGSLAITSASSSWTLQAQASSGGGQMVASAAGCSHSDPHLANALNASISTSQSGISTPQNPIILSATPQTVATATSVPLTLTLTTDYSVSIPLSEALQTGCTYTITVTYTLQ